MCLYITMAVKHHISKEYEKVKSCETWFWREGYKQEQVIAQQRFNVEQRKETDREGAREDSPCGWLVVSETCEAIPTCHPWKFPGREPLYIRTIP